MDAGGAVGALQMIHVLPINDLKEHEETTTCWCNPKVEFSDPETGEAHEGLVIHNSADGREFVEQAERIVNG